MSDVQKVIETFGFPTLRYNYPNSKKVYAGDTLAIPMGILVHDPSGDDGVRVVSLCCIEITVPFDHCLLHSLQYRHAVNSDNSLSREATVTLQNAETLALTEHPASIEPESKEADEVEIGVILAHEVGDAGELRGILSDSVYEMVVGYRKENYVPPPPDADHIVLSTGKRVYAFSGMVGLSVHKGVRSRSRLRYGYDGDIKTVLDEELPPHEAASALNAAECVELADMMIERWTAFRDEAQRRLDA